MKKQRTYTEGVVVGLFVGLAASLVLPRLLSGSRGVAAARADVFDAPPSQQDFVSLRDQPESAGDPMHGSGAEFARGGGAPGPGGHGEQLAMPGRPGQMVNTTRSRKVKVANRALPLKKPATRRPRSTPVAPPEPVTGA